MMMEVRLMLHDARVTRPEKSGDYLVCRVYEAMRPLWLQVPYSKENDSFNAHDYDSAEDAAKTAVNADYWCDNPLDYLRKYAAEDAPTLETAFPGAHEPFAGDIADGGAVARMRRYSIDAPEEPDYNAYPVGE